MGFSPSATSNSCFCKKNPIILFKVNFMFLLKRVNSFAQLCSVLLSFAQLFSALLSFLLSFAQLCSALANSLPLALLRLSWAIAQDHCTGGC